MPMRTIKRPNGGMYDTLDMHKILEQKEKKSGYEPQGAWGMWIVRNYDRLQKRWNRSEKQGKARMPFIREVGINCTPLCMENCGRS